MKICRDFPEKWGASGNEYTCSVEGLVLSCTGIGSGETVTVTYTFPSIEAAKLSTLDWQTAIVAGIGWRWTNFKISSSNVDWSSTLDSTNRLATWKDENYTQYTGTFSNYDSHGYPQTFSGSSGTYTFTYEYTDGGNLPSKITNSTGSILQYTNGIMTSFQCSTTNGCGSATLVTSGTVQMCEEK